MHIQTDNLYYHTSPYYKNNHVSAARNLNHVSGINQ